MTEKSAFTLRSGESSGEMGTPEERIRLETAPSSERLGDLGQDEARVKSYQYFLSLINGDKIGNEKELRSRFVAEFDQQGYLQAPGRGQGTLEDVEGKDGPVRIFNADERQFRLENAEQAELLVELFNLQNDATIPDELRNNLRLFITQKDERALERLQEVGVMVGQTDVSSKLLTFLERYRRETGRVDLENGFYERLSRGENFEATAAYLEAYDTKTDEDLLLAGKLRAKLFAKRRLETVASVASTDELAIPDNVRSETSFLSPLLAYTIGNRIEVGSGPRGEEDFTGGLIFELIYDDSARKIKLTYAGGTPPTKKFTPISSEFLTEVTEPCADPDFQQYALSALRKRWRDPKLGLTVSFKNGKIDPAITFVQEG